MELKKVLGLEVWLIMKSRESVMLTLDIDKYRNLRELCLKFYTGGMVYFRDYHSIQQFDSAEISRIKVYVKLSDKGMNFDEFLSTEEAVEMDFKTLQPHEIIDLTHIRV